MKILVFALATILVAKDTIGIPAPYVLRAIVQATCGVAGLFYLFSALPQGMLQKYWPVWGYLTALLISVSFSNSPMYVFLQVGSLGGIMVFGIALFESGEAGQGSNLDLLIRTAGILYLVVAVLSVITLLSDPGRAYEVETVHRRFRGLFAEPGMMANASGLLLGIGLFGLKHRVLKSGAIIFGAICIGLALSRTNWVALIAASLATGWLYYPRFRRVVLAISALAVLAGLVTVALNITIDTERANRIARVESLATLSGRTVLWEASIRAMSRSPVFGNGYTTGVDALIETSKRNEARYLDHIADLETRRGTIHSGYIQSLLDSGLVGTFFYVTLIVLGLKRLLSNDQQRQFGVVFFIVMYAAIANLGKNFIYSASVFDAVLFWLVIPVALGVLRTEEGVVTPTLERRVKYPNIVDNRAGRLPPKTTT